MLFANFQRVLARVDRTCATFDDIEAIRRFSFLHYYTSSLESFLVETPCHFFDQSVGNVIRWNIVFDDADIFRCENLFEQFG